MSELDAHGLVVDVPAGWEGRIFVRPEAGAAAADAEIPGLPAPQGERSFPLVHAATVPIPPDTADFGSDLVTDLGPEDAFIVLKEFDPAVAGQALFAREGMPRTLATMDFSPASLQRQLDGQGGHQAFFHEGGRAFCVYVVLGDLTRAANVVPRVNEVLATVVIASQPAPTP